MRAFLALPLRPPAVASFEALRARLVSDVPDVRWTPAESPHITLHFFGAISAPESERALKILRPVVAVQPPMVLRLRGLGSFPSAAEPRVLWYGVGGDTTVLTALARACGAALRAAGFAVDDRPYRAHCTLGRPRRPWPVDARHTWRRFELGEPSTPTFNADRVCLYESLPGPSGEVRHVVRETVPLGSTSLSRGPVAS